jgi:hypothetical protein
MVLVIRELKGRDLRAETGLVENDFTEMGAVVADARKKVRTWLSQPVRLRLLGLMGEMAEMG